MQNEFCTLFDLNYLPRGLVLYRSLERHCDDFRLRVFCMDAETKELLDRLALPRLTAIGLDELEAHDRELLAVKPTRTQVEYCWTATPAVCAYALETEPDLDAITYLDADLMFFRDPAPIWQELGDDSVLIVPHRYAPRWQAHEETSGIYNVEFMTFRRDERGLEALHWWRDRCLEWCYFRVEDGKMGDQKYLDDWPDRFAGVHVLEHPGGGLAPWNVERYELACRNGSILVDDRELVFYHYHSLRLYRGITALRAAGLLSDAFRYTRGPVPFVWTTNYPVDAAERQLVWDPYLDELGRAFQEVRRKEGGFDAGFVDLDGRALLFDLGRRIVSARLPRVASAAGQVKRRVLGSREDHAESWKADDVADQMLELARDQLREPDSVPPYRSFLEAIEWALAELPLPDPARLLDFGCGVGHYSELLERRFPGRFEYTGCDYSEAMVEAARGQWVDRRFVTNDLFANTLDLGAFDLVVAGALVDVTEDYERALDVLLGSEAPYVLLHRQQLTTGASRAEVVPGYSGQTTYRSYLNSADLERIAAGHGRSILASFDVQDDIHSFLFGKKAS
ncbi:MAG TPA: class I SAM-dependent methyltransferase [Gaiellaceae bacterium]|nr:class I SAM-dependent methyltransferase [Gaiellaceae bacterium]